MVLDLVEKERGLTEGLHDATLTVEKNIFNQLYCD